MKKSLIILFILSITFNLSAQVNGTVEEIDGKKVLTVWGTHYERGYAHGYLMGANFKEIFDEYIVDFLCYGSSQTYSGLRSFFMNYYTIESKYQTEAEAAIQGMIDSGVNPNNTVLGRAIDATDLLICTTLPDLSQTRSEMREMNLGCSSISSWGNSTLQDPVLAGELIITRLMDWSVHSALCNNHLLIVNIPSEQDEQKWISLAFAGFLGSLSGINESGVAAFMNVGNVTTYQTSSTFYPILLNVRNGIEAFDYDQDSANTPNDVVQAVQDRNRSGASIIHVVKNEGVNSSPLIIECNNENGVSVRDMSNNTSVSGENLVATNHFRTLYAPTACYRYSGIADSLNNSQEVTPDRSWSILKKAAGIPWNLHAMQYNEPARILKWAASTTTTPAYLQNPTIFNLDTLFNYTTYIEKYNNQNQVADFALLKNYPNPFNPTTTIEFSLAKTEYITLKIYNSIGEEVAALVSGKFGNGKHKYNWNAGELAGGLYFCRLQAGVSSKVNKLILMK